MTANTEYYWRIDEVTAESSIITGELWTFKTVPVLSANLCHYWPFDVDYLDVAEMAFNWLAAEDIQLYFKI